MASPNLSHVDIKVQNRSAFDKSFKNILTTKVGTITPLVSKLLIPGTKGHMKLAISASLPPLASDTFMRASLKVEAFMVPLRLLYGGYESYLTGSEISSSGTMKRATLPRLIYRTAQSAKVAPGTLADYLGFCSAQAEDSMYINILPFLAYWRCISDWYQNRKIEKELFYPYSNDTGNTDDPTALRFLPYSAFTTTHNYSFASPISSSYVISDLAQRNWDDDYFTIATPSPQFGNAQKVTIDSNSQFTISALRAANSMQQFEERNNLASPRMADYVAANYGAKLSNGVAQRAVLLGSASYDVYSKGVTAAADSTPTNNPFGSVGARYGNAFASGTDFVCEFEANEPAYLMVMCTLVPEANYCTGIRHDLRLFTESGSQTDLPNPMLQNVGNEPIYKSEVLDGSTTPSIFTDGIFGYVQRYLWHKTSRNEVHGLLRLGQSLAPFVAQRAFTIDAEISSNFLKIPTNALDNVTAVTGDLSAYGCWVDSYVDLKISEPLAESSLPSLQDPAYEHGHDVRLKINGNSL